MKLITPYLPQAAENIIASWEREHRKPAFIVAVEHHPKWLGCQNCNGIGVVYLRLCNAGPYQAPRSSNTVYTWFDGNECWGKGFYIVKETMGFVCPKCNGVAHEPGKPITPERMAVLMNSEEQLVKKLG